MYNRGFNASAMYKHTFSEAFKLMEKLSYTYDDIDYFGTESLDYLTSDRPIYDHYYMTKDKQGNDTKSISARTPSTTVTRYAFHISLKL